MPEHELVNPLEVENWNNLVATMPEYSFFHTANWADVLSQSYEYKPFYLCKKTNGALENLMPIMEVASILTGIRGVSLPFSDACPLPVSNKDQFQSLFNQAVDLGKKRKWKYLELRGGEEHLSKEKPSAIFWGHKLDLSCGSEKLFSGLRNSTQRNIKKAQSANVEVSISQSLAAVKEFCRLNALTRKEHGLPPQPNKFFKHLHEQVIDRDMGFVVLASIGNHTIAANVYLYFGTEVIYKYGASNKKYQRLRANNLVMWEAIKWSCDRGFKTMNFGRTEPEHKGLMQFKDGWGGRTYKIVYYRYSLKEDTFIGASETITPAIKKIFSNLPAPILRVLGNFLYRHTG